MAPVCLREMTAAEHAAVQKLAHSHTAPAQACSVRKSSGAQVVARAPRRLPPGSALMARPCASASAGSTRKGWRPSRTATARAAGRPTRPSGRHGDRHRADKPATLGLPFAAWTLDRLAAYLQEHKGIAMRRSRIDEILLREGLRWRKHETWFGERVDPEFAEKRGASRRSTPHRLMAVVVCLDEMGPVSAKSYAGRDLVRATRDRRAPDRRSTTVAAARATSSALSVPRRATLSRVPIRAAAPRTGWTFWRTSRPGSAQDRAGLRDWIT